MGEIIITHKLKSRGEPIIFSSVLPSREKKRDPFSIIFYDFRSESGKNSEPYPLVKSGETPFR